MALSRHFIIKTLPFLHHHHTNPRKTLTSISPKSMAWTCSKCTFINPDSQKSSCQICLSPSTLTLSSSPLPSSSSSSQSPTETPKWSCKTCTFLNSYQKSNCEICGTRASASLISTFECDDDDVSDCPVGVGKVFLPLRRCSNKRKEREENPIEVVDDVVELSGLRGAKLASKAVVDETRSVTDETCSVTEMGTVKILSYNVWFREDLEMRNRMKAIGDLIRLHSPDVICLQEVTPDIYGLFQQSNWWKSYKCSLSNEMAVTRAYFCMQLSKLPVESFTCKPFGYSAMGRELCIAEVAVKGGVPLVVATSHLESPCPGPPKWDQMYSRERVNQAKEAVSFLNKYRNVIFCGDMNWDDKSDGPFPLPNGWIDVWTKLRPNEDGWTYDTKSNQMLSGNRKLQKRLDRFVCNLGDFKVSGIEMIGMKAIPELSYLKEKKGGKSLELPVLPSDHYGLLLTISGL